MSDQTSAKAPTVEQWMTEAPIGIEESILVADAAERMGLHDIRHLPVFDDDGELVGVLSQRDVALVDAIPGVERTDVTVGMVMSSPAVVCAPGDLVEDVLEQMMADRRSSTFVVRDGEVVGVLTTHDVLEMTLDLLRRRG